MNKELQNHVWKHCLPKEFKEEVKIYYQYAYVQYGKSDLYRGSANAIESLFGIHNLTSDAEGEDDEMLYVSRKKLQYFYEKLRKVGENHVAFALQSLFGSKCLPDEEPKPAEMTEGRYQYLNSLSLEDYDNETSAEEQRKFCEYQHKHHPDEVEWLQTHSDDNEPKPAEPMYHVGEEFKWRAKIVKIDAIIDRGKYFEYIVSTRDGNRYRLMESDLEPYTEPTETCTDDCSSQCESQDFHDFIKDGFHDHNRLYIAAMLAAGMAGTWSDTPQEGSIADKCANLAELSFKIADALIEQSQNQ